MNRETIITAIVTLIVAVFDLLKIFGIFVPIDSNELYTIVSAIVFLVCYWRNQSWTRGGWAGTRIGRAIKQAEADGDLTLHDEIEHMLKEANHDN